MNHDATITGNTIILGHRDCFCVIGAAGNGREYADKSCGACHGTGRTKGGTGKGECRACAGHYPRGHVTDFDHTIPCKRCQGNWSRHDPADCCDYATPEVIDHVFANIPFVVVRQARDSSFNEHSLGLGCWYSISGYDKGKYAAMTDEALVAEVRAHSKHVQYTKFCNDTDDRQVLELCSEVLIIVTDYGYSVRSAFGNSAQVANHAEHEISQYAAHVLDGLIDSSSVNVTVLAASL